MACAPLILLVVSALLSQLLAGLVKLGNSSRASTYEPLLSRRYGYVLLGRYVVELELNEVLRLVTSKFYMENAVGLLQQVGWKAGLAL